MRDQVFISYSRQTDTGFARRLARILYAASFNVWLDEEQIAPGDDYERALQMALAESHHAVFVVSVRWFEREWTRYEVQAFAESGPDRRRVAILRFPRGTRDLGPRLELLHNVEWVDDADEAACTHLVVCGLTGEKPGPAEDWSRRGEKLMARVPSAAIAAARAPGADPQRRVETRDRDGVYLSCDRSEQWDALTQILRHKLNQLILLPGPRGEAHDEFMLRVKAHLPPDRPRRIVSVTWTQYPCPYQAEVLLADLARALEVAEAGLADALRVELGHRDLVVLQPIAHCFDDPALHDYLTRVLPGCLRETAGGAFSLKVVQPVEWVVERLPSRILGWLVRLLVGGKRDAAGGAAAFMEGITDSAAPDLPAVRLPELGRIQIKHLEAFCEANRLPRSQRAAFIEEVLRGARSSRDILLNIQRQFPANGLT